MNNLHRELAPISDGAWAQIEQEAARTLKRYLAGRRVVDLKEPGGVMLAAVGTGHLHDIEAPAAVAATAGASGVTVSRNESEGTKNKPPVTARLKSSSRS